MRKAFEGIKNKFKGVDKYVIVLHLGTACGLIGFACTDPLYLRIGSNLSEGAAVAFNLSRLPTPIWTPVYWSAAFMSVNTVNIAQLLYDRQDVEFTGEEGYLYEMTFRKSGMRPIQFKRLIDAGRVVTFQPGDVIFEEGTVNNNVYILISGAVTISVRDEFIASMSGDDVGAFLGEMQLLESFMDHAHIHTTLRDHNTTQGNSGSGNVSTGHYAAKSVLTKKASDEPAVERLKLNTVTAVGEVPVKAIAWDMNHLLRVLEEQDELAASLRSVLLSTLLKKLRRNSTQQENPTEDCYFGMMQKYLSTGAISSQQRQELRQMAHNNFISMKFHYECLKDLGWTEYEYITGKKQNLSLVVDSQPNAAAQSQSQSTQAAGSGAASSTSTSGNTIVLTSSSASGTGANTDRIKLNSSKDSV